MMLLVPKVLVYLISNGHVLVFRHRDVPEAGLQVPAGTMGKDESPLAAAVRELQEESGLQPVAAARFLREYFYRPEWTDDDVLHHRFLVSITDDSLPLTPFEHVVTGGEEGDTDHGMTFLFEWMSIEQASRELEWGHDAGLVP